MVHIDTSLELHLMETWTLPGYIKFGDTRDMTPGGIKGAHPPVHYSII
jgi:hypothetical protein